MLESVEKFAQCIQKIGIPSAASSVVLRLNLLAQRHTTSLTSNTLLAVAMRVLLQRALLPAQGFAALSPLCATSTKPSKTETSGAGQANSRFGGNEQSPKLRERNRIREREGCGAEGARGACGRGERSR